MDEQYLYSVSYKDWNSDLSGLIDRQMLAAGTSEEDAINNAKRQARSDSRDFNAIRIDAVMGMDISVVQPEARAADIGIEREATSSVPGPPIQAYIENAYLLLMGDDGAHITETAHAYRHGTDAFDHWMHAAEAPGTQAFTIHLTEVHGQITGNIAQVDARARWLDISENSIHPVKVEATIKVGETLEYTPEEWDALDPIEKDGMQNWRRVFEDDAFSEVFHHVAEAARKDEDTCQPVSGQAFLAAVNAAYMEQARCPQPKLMRVSQAAAQEMLARGDSDVYRLLPEGPEKLSPTDAIKSGLWFSEHREFAIRREDMAGLEKWAERSVVAIMSRPQERDEPKKAHEQEV